MGGKEKERERERKREKERERASAITRARARAREGEGMGGWMWRISFPTHQRAHIGAGGLEPALNRPHQHRLRCSLRRRRRPVRLHRRGCVGRGGGEGGGELAHGIADEPAWRGTSDNDTSI